MALRDLLREAFVAAGRSTEGLDELVTVEAEAIGFDERFLDRPLNVDLSGGEKKRNETLQLGVLDPKIAVLDELDSGLDVDALRAVSRRIEAVTNTEGIGVLAITHYSRLLTVLRADTVHVLSGGRIQASGGPELAEELERTGYADYAEPAAVSAIAAGRPLRRSVRLTPHVSSSSVRRHIRALLLLVMAFAVVGAGAGIAVAAASHDEPEPVQVVASSFALAGDGDATAMRPIHGFHAAEALVAELEAFDSPAPAPGTPPSSTLPNPTRDGACSSCRSSTPIPRVSGCTRSCRSDRTARRGGSGPPTSASSTYRTASRSTSPRTSCACSEATPTRCWSRRRWRPARPSTPTPLGDFFIDIYNPLGHHAVYGWGQMSISAFSDVLYSFGGGIGQVAIHGWNDDSVMGQHVSNGCIRMRNDDIALVAAVDGPRARR